MFVCVECKKEKREKDRRFVGNDWCIGCCEKELDRTKPADGGYIRSEPPGYVLRPKG